MAKKRTPTEARNRSLKYGRPTTPTAVTSSNVKSGTPVAEITSDGRSFAYVRRDLMAIVVIGGALLLLELILAYLFDHTGLGSAVYRLVSV